MALPATMVFEIRPTDGAADNGGGFDSAKSGVGTDRSQQNAAQVVIDNVAITCTTPAANSNVLTFTAGYAPAAVDEGNAVAITGGTNINAGIYVINSVVVGTSWTVSGSTNLTTAGGAGSAITGNMGGARGGGSAGYSNGTTTLQSRLLPGHNVFIKGSGQTWNEAVVLTVAGTAAAPITHIGYNAIRNDNPTGATRPNNDRGGANSIAFAINNNLNILKHLIGSNTGTQSVFSLSGSANIQLIHCRGTGSGSGNGFLGNGLASNIRLFACEADANGVVGFSLGDAVNCCAVACNAHGNTNGGFNGIAGSHLINCISWANTGPGFLTSTATALTMVNCISDGNTGAATDGLSVGTPNSAFIVNCIFSNNGRDGARATDGDSIIADHNDFFGNVGTSRTNFPAGVDDVALDPTFTNRAAGDFSIGTNLKALGFPGVFPGATSTGYLDIGAVQRQEAAATADMIRSRVLAGF